MIELVDAGGIRCNMKRGSVMTSNHGLINSLAVSDATFLLPFVMFIVCLFWTGQNQVLYIMLAGG